MASPNISGTGYDHVFLDPPTKLKKLQCPLCLLVTREPNLTSCCGQHFCQSCINCVLISRKPCPFCKEENFTVLLDKRRKRKILELKVRCSLKDHGCDWIGGLGELTTHTDKQNGNCEFVSITCPNSCGDSYKRRHMGFHLMNECRNRPFTCKYCQFEATYELVHRHYNECETFPLNCPNKCEVQTVERAKMAEHLSECPLQLVECEYAYVGCSEKIRRKDLAMHMEQNVQKHLLWAFTASQKQLVALERQMQQRVATLQSDKERQLRALKCEMNEIRKENDAVLRKKDSQIERLQSRITALEKHTALQESMEFTVYNYSELEGKGIRKNSRAFYLWPRGPRFYLSVNFSQEIEVGLYQLPGEFDKEIHWSGFFLAVKLYLLNQLDGHNHRCWRIACQVSKPTKQACVCH